MYGEEGSDAEKGEKGEKGEQGAVQQSHKRMGHFGDPTYASRGGREGESHEQVIGPGTCGTTTKEIRGAK